MPKILLKDVLKQIKADLIGKDSYRGVTLTYSWLANQFGHFALGYIPTLIAWAILRHTSNRNPAFWGAIIVSCLWLLFELYNFLGPLLLKSRSRSKLLFVAEQKYVFQPAWGNIAFDTITDLSFLWIGAFSASSFLHYFPATIYIICILVLFLFYPTAYWYVTKMYIQYAGLPMQFRLSQWCGDWPGDQPKDVVLNFVNAPQDTLGNHLLIFGGRRSDKSSLSVGITTEKAIKRFTCAYSSAMSFYDLLSLTDQEIINSENSQWSWRTASLLVIDDINPGSPITRDFISPPELLKLIDTPVNGDDKLNRKQLAGKDVIWVMGDENGGGYTLSDWKDLLLKIGVPENKITLVDLGFHSTRVN